MQFDSTRLRGMSPQDRQQAVTRLAILLPQPRKQDEDRQRQHHRRRHPEHQQRQHHMPVADKAEPRQRMGGRQAQRDAQRDIQRDMAGRAEHRGAQFRRRQHGGIVHQAHGAFGHPALGQGQRQAQQNRLGQRQHDGQRAAQPRQFDVPKHRQREAPSIAAACR